MKNANSLNYRQSKIQKIKICDIERNPSQPRRVFETASIRALADSIAQNGLLQPISVRKQGRGYELIAGERRLRALTLLGESHAPCIVVDADMQNSAVLAIIENIQRRDLNIFEEAAAIETLISTLSLTQAQVAQKLRVDMIAAFRKKYVKNATVACKMQTAQTLALAYGVFTTEEEESAYEVLKSLIERDNDRIKVGCFGLKYIFDQLSERGDTAKAVELV